MTTATQTAPQSIEDEIASASAATVPTPIASDGGQAAPGTQPAPEGTEISARKAGSIRKQQEEQARQSQLIADGVAVALARLGLTPQQQAPAAVAPAPAVAALPDYLDGIEPTARTEWAESLKLTQRVGLNVEERAVARVRAEMEARFGPQFKALEETMNRNHAALRTGVASSFSAANSVVQKAEVTDGWNDWLQAEDESGMVRSTAYQYWMNTDPARAAKVLNNYATNFLTANKQTIPTGFAHMATPAEATGGSSGVTETRQTVSAGAINKLIADELQKPNPSPARLQGLRDNFDKHAKAGTLVA